MTPKRSPTGRFAGWTSQTIQIWGFRRKGNWGCHREHSRGRRGYREEKGQKLGRGTGGVLTVSSWLGPVDGCLLTQQRLGSLLELSRQPWALLQLSWEAPRTISGGHGHGWTGRSEATPWLYTLSLAPLARSECQEGSCPSR